TKSWQEDERTESPLAREQVYRIARRQLQQAFELHPGLLEYANRRIVARRRDRENASQAERMIAVCEHCRCCFICVALSSELGKKRIADVGVRHRVALDQPAHPRRLAAFPLFDAIHAEAVALIHIERTFAQVAAGGGQAVDALSAAEHTRQTRGA